MSAAESRLSSVFSELPSRTLPESERAAQTLELLHTGVLTGRYHADVTDVVETLNTGDYNCVSSAVLYWVLAEKCGLRVSAVVLREHVYLVVETERGPLRVEPTRSQLATSSALLSPNEGRRIDAAALVALIYYNRGQRAILEGDFEQAVEFNRHALELDPQNSAVHKNLLIAINNWAVARSASGDLDGALALLQAGQVAAPEHGAFRRNEIILRAQQANALRAAP